MLSCFSGDLSKDQPDHFYLIGVYIMICVMFKLINLIDICAEFVNLYYEILNV